MRNLTTGMKQILQIDFSHKKPRLLILPEDGGGESFVISSALAKALVKAGMTHQG